MNTNTRWTRVQTDLMKNYWVIPVVISIVTFISEYIDHHHEGQLLSNKEFLIEVFIFSIIFPLIFGVIMYYMRTFFKERNSLTAEMNLIINLGNQLAKSETWDDLLFSIRDYLQKYISLSRIYLGVFNPIEKDIKIVSFWPSNLSLDKSLSQGISEFSRTPALNPKYNQSADFNSSQLVQLDSQDKEILRYGIPLKIKDFLIAMIIFDVSATHLLSPSHIQTITSIIPELSMAIAYEYTNEFSMDQNKSNQEERRKIARVLHDTLAQDISYLQMKLEMLREQDSLIGILDVQRDLKRMGTVAQRAYDQVRNNLNSLIPDVPKNISQAIQILAHEICDPVEIEINYEETGESQPLQTDTMTKILNISREAFTNIVNHSGASLVNINIFWSEFQVDIEIEDNGIGIAADACIKDQHFGMIFMKERTEEINADLQILSKQNEGTKIHLSLPLLEKIDVA